MLICVLVRLDLIVIRGTIIYHSINGFKTKLKIARTLASPFVLVVYAYTCIMKKYTASRNIFFFFLLVKLNKF